MINAIDIQGFHITFNKGGWGYKPVADEVELCKSFSTKQEAIDWMNEKNIHFERKFAIAQSGYDNQCDEPDTPNDELDDFDEIEDLDEFDW